MIPIIRLAWLLLILPLATSAQVKKVTGDDLSTDKLDRFIEHQLDSLTIPGLSIAILNDGKTVYHRTFGFSDPEKKKPVDSETIFEAASLSKPLFAYFALKMAETHVIDLNRPLYEYLPHPGIDSAYVEDFRKITARMILCHSTGFPNWSNGEAIRLSHPPGNGFSYSGEAYQFLAAVIGTRLEVGWKTRLDSVFQMTVAQPLGLKNSFYTWNDYCAQHKATGFREGKYTDAGDQGTSFGAGYSLHTEAADYARFMEELFAGDHLDSKLHDLMFTTANTFDEDNELREIGQTGWTLGLSVRPTPAGTRFMHTGNNHDFQSYMCLYPENGYGLVLFMNSDKLEVFYEQLGTYLNDPF